MRGHTTTVEEIEAQFRKARETEKDGESLLVRTESRPVLPRERPKAPPEEPQPSELPPAPVPALETAKNGHRGQKSKPTPAGQLTLFDLE